MIFEKIQADRIEAMKVKDIIKKDVCSNLIAAIKNLAIKEKQRDNITDELAIAAILKEQKTAKEMLEGCPSGRDDLRSEYQANYDIISSYAPSLMENEDEILEFVKNLNIEMIKSNRGAIMAALKGKANMKVANQVISKNLK